MLLPQREIGHKLKQVNKAGSEKTPHPHPAHPLTQSPLGKCAQVLEGTRKPGFLLFGTNSTYSPPLPCWPYTRMPPLPRNLLSSHSSVPLAWWIQEKLVLLGPGVVLASSLAFETSHDVVSCVSRTPKSPPTHHTRQTRVCHGGFTWRLGPPHTRRG